MTRATGAVWLLLAAIALPAAPRAYAQAPDKTLRIVPHAGLAILDPIWTRGYIKRNHGHPTAAAPTFHRRSPTERACPTRHEPSGTTHTALIRPILRWCGRATT